MDEMRTPVRDIGPPEDSYAMWDAAYVLGSLSAAQRREFETHMAHCGACRSAVVDVSGVPALLSQLDHGEVAALKLGPQCCLSGLHAVGVIRAPGGHGGVPGLVHPDQLRHL